MQTGMPGRAGGTVLLCRFGVTVEGRLSCARPAPRLRTGRPVIVTASAKVRRRVHRAIDGGVRTRKLSFTLCTACASSAAKKLTNVLLGCRTAQSITEKSVSTRRWCALCPDSDFPSKGLCYRLQNCKFPLETRSTVACLTSTPYSGCFAGGVERSAEKSLPAPCAEV